MAYLRARVMARLAAALQPAADPEGPIQIARDAIAMARRLGDRETLLDTMRNGGSAMVDLGDLEERILLDREHAVLAEELGNPVEALRGNLRSIMDYLQLGRLDDAFRAMRACERITDDLNHPAYRWRPIALRVLRATWEGDFDEAERLAEEVHWLGERAADHNAALPTPCKRRGCFDCAGTSMHSCLGSRRSTGFGGALRLPGPTQTSSSARSTLPPAGCHSV